MLRQFNDTLCRLSSTLASALVIVCISSTAYSIEWKGIVVHHSTSPRWTTVEDIRKWHIDDNEWDDIGYHYVIYPDGSIHEGRPIDKIGAHAKGRNTTHIGICLVGYDSFTDEQVKSLDKLIIELSLPIERHHEKCPGNGIKIK